MVVVDDFRFQPAINALPLAARDWGFGHVLDPAVFPVDRAEMVCRSVAMIALMIDALSVRSVARLTTSGPTSKIAWEKPSVDIHGLPVSETWVAPRSLADMPVRDDA